MPLSQDDLKALSNDALKNKYQTLFRQLNQNQNRSHVADEFIPVAIEYSMRARIQASQGHDENKQLKYLLAAFFRAANAETVCTNEELRGTILDHILEIFYHFMAIDPNKFLVYFKGNNQLSTKLAETIVKICLEDIDINRLPRLRSLSDTLAAEEQLAPLYHTFYNILAFDSFEQFKKIDIGNYDKWLAAYTQAEKDFDVVMTPLAQKVIRTENEHADYVYFLNLKLSFYTIALTQARKTSDFSAFEKVEEIEKTANAFFNAVKKQKALSEYDRNALKDNLSELEDALLNEPLQQRSDRLSQSREKTSEPLHMSTANELIDSLVPHRRTTPSSARKIPRKRRSNKIKTTLSKEKASQVSHREKSISRKRKRAEIEPVNTPPLQPGAFSIEKPPAITSSNHALSPPQDSTLPLKKRSKSVSPESEITPAQQTQNHSIVFSREYIFTLLAATINYTFQSLENRDYDGNDLPHIYIRPPEHDLTILTDKHTLQDAICTYLREFGIAPNMLPDGTVYITDPSEKKVFHLDWLEGKYLPNNATSPTFYSAGAGTEFTFFDSRPNSPTSFNNAPYESTQPKKEYADASTQTSENAPSEVSFNA